MLKRVISRFFVEVFLSCSTEKLRRGTLLCCVSENFWFRKSLWIRGGGEVLRFSVEYFLSHSAENFVKEPLGVHYFRVSKNVRDRS